MLRALLCHPPPHRPTQSDDDVCVCVHACVGTVAAVWTLLFWGVPTFTGPRRKCLTLPRPYNRKLKVACVCIFVSVCVCVSATSETTRLLNTNTDIRVDSASGYGLTLSYHLSLRVRRLWRIVCRGRSRRFILPLRARRRLSSPRYGLKQHAHTHTPFIPVFTAINRGI